MKSYLIYKNQIKGFRDIAETVKVIERVAASNIHFLKNKVESLNVYIKEMEQVLSRLMLFHQEQKHPLLEHKTGKQALVVMGGEKGMVGGLWHDIIDTYFSKREQYSDIIAVGSKSAQYLNEEGVDFQKSFSFGEGIPSAEEIREVTDYVFSEFMRGELAKVDILFSKFISLTEQNPQFVSFLPFEFDLETEKTQSFGLPVFEPSAEEFFGSLLQKYIGLFFHLIVFEVRLCEFSARAVTAEHVTEKTKKMIKKLKLNYFKMRSADLTKKQLESFTAHNKIL